jgi:Sec-independent protein translocase protein TatA
MTLSGLFGAKQVRELQKDAGRSSVGFRED